MGHVVVVVVVVVIVLVAVVVVAVVHDISWEAVRAGPSKTMNGLMGRAERPI